MNKEKLIEMGLTEEQAQFGQQVNKSDEDIPF